MYVFVFMAYLMIATFMIVAIPEYKVITDILDRNKLLDALVPTLVLLWPITLIPTVIYLIYKNYKK